MTRKIIIQDATTPSRSIGPPPLIMLPLCFCAALNAARMRVLHLRVIVPIPSASRLNAGRLRVLNLSQSGEWPDDSASQAAGKTIP